MSRLSLAGVDEVVAFNRRVLTLDSVDTLLGETLADLERLFQATSSMFLLRPEGSPIATFDRGLAHGIPDRLVQSFAFEALEVDPFARVLLSNPGLDLEREVRLGSELVPYERLVRTWFYERYMRPYDLHHMLRMELIVGSRSLATVGMFRPMSAPTFSAVDRARAMLVVSTLAGALDRALQREVYQENWSLLERNASAAGGVGVAVLDERMRMIYCDDTARQHLTTVCDARGCGDGPTLPAALLDSLNRVLTENRDTDDFDRPAEVMLATGGAAMERLRICINAQKTPHGRQRALLFVRKENITGGPMPTDLPGLTPREIEVVRLVMTGLRNHEIADRMAISINTVQTHLRTIFAKENVRNRTQLLVKLTPAMRRQ